MITDQVDEALEVIATSRSRNHMGVKDSRRQALREHRAAIMCWLDGHDHMPRPRRKYRTQVWTCPRCHESFITQLGCCFAGCVWEWVAVTRP